MRERTELEGRVLPEHAAPRVLTKDKRAVWNFVLGKWRFEGGREPSGEAEKFRRTNPRRLQMAI